MPIIVKNTTFPGLLDLLAPHSCRGCGRLGDVLCDRCKNYIIHAHPHHFCPNCRQIITKPTKSKRPAKSPSFLKYAPQKRSTHGCPHCHFPTAYVVGTRDGLLGTLIHDYKYDSTRAISSQLASILHATLPQLPANTAIIPLPTAAKHIRARGLDHTYLIAKRFCHLRHLELQKLLLRAKDTVQVGATRKDRLRQASSAYALNSKIPTSSNITYLLLDDVWTTGASMKAAIEQLRTAGIPIKNIRVAVLAISELD